VGTGSATWITTIGLDGSLTCDAANPCELVLQTEITNGTVYFRAPLCYGTACPADTDPNVAPVPAPAPAPPAAGTAGAAGGAAATPEASDSASGKPVSAASANAVGGVKGVKGLGTSQSSSHASETELASTQSASAVSVPGKGLSRSVRVLLALLAGVIGGALIVAIVNHSRTRGQSLGSA